MIAQTVQIITASGVHSGPANPWWFSTGLPVLLVVAAFAANVWNIYRQSK